MERNANYALVGLISTILLIAMIVFIFWLTNFAFSQHFDRYNVVFHGPISGLSKGGEVAFNGIKVGEVSDIVLNAKDPSLVVATIRVQSDTPVRQDSYATLELVGITGVNNLEITSGTPSKPLLKDLPLVDDQKLPTIYAKGGGLSDLLAGGGAMVQKAVEALNRVNQVLSDQNIQKFSAIMSDVQSVTAELKARKAIIGDADKALLTADSTLQTYKTLGVSANNLVNGEGKQSLVKLQSTADEVQGLAKDLRDLVAKLKTPTADFANNGLPRLTSAIANLQTATQNLDRLVSEVQQDPRGLIEKPAAKEVEVKP